MSVCIDYPCILEIVRFPVKDKSETLSSLKCYPVKDQQRYEMFSILTLRGIVLVQD